LHGNLDEINESRGVEKSMDEPSDSYTNPFARVDPFSKNLKAEDKY
jgi:hypothetical protein